MIKLSPTETTCVTPIAVSIPALPACSLGLAMVGRVFICAAPTAVPQYHARWTEIQLCFERLRGFVVTTSTVYRSLLSIGVLNGASATRFSDTVYPKSHRNH